MDYGRKVRVEYMRQGEHEWGHAHDEWEIKLERLRQHCQLISEVFGTRARIVQDGQVIYETLKPHNP